MYHVAGYEFGALESEEMVLRISEETCANTCDHECIANLVDSFSFDIFQRSRR